MDGGEREIWRHKKEEKEDLVGGVIDLVEGEGLYEHQSTVIRPRRGKGGH